MAKTLSADRCNVFVERIGMLRTDYSGMITLDLQVS